MNIKLIDKTNYVEYMIEHMERLRKNIFDWLQSKNEIDKAREEYKELKRLSEIGKSTEFAFKVGKAIMYVEPNFNTNTMQFEYEENRIGIGCVQHLVEWYERINKNDL